MSSLVVQALVVSGPLFPGALVDECHAKRVDVHTSALCAVLGAGGEESRTVVEEAVQELEQRSEDHAWTICSGGLGLECLFCESGFGRMMEHPRGYFRFFSTQHRGRL